MRSPGRRSRWLRRPTEEEEPVLAARAGAESAREPARAGVVDELADTGLKVGLQLGRLVRGDLPVRLGLVDLRVRVGDERLDETVAALAGRRVRDLGEA